MHLALWSALRAHQGFSTYFRNPIFPGSPAPLFLRLPFSLRVPCACCSSFDPRREVKRRNGGRGGAAIRPEDPTLPKPWRGLVDGSTGYLYYWNPETNVTQYERPSRSSCPLLPRLCSPRPSPPSPQVRLPRPRLRRPPPSPDRHRHSSHSRSSQAGGSKGGSGSADNHGHGAKDSRDAKPASSAEAYRRQHEIIVTGDNVPAPFTTFESTNFSSEILKEVHHAGFSSPTPIQAQAWPIVLQSRDIVAIAKTGSGKTLGYLIPGFIHLKRLRNNSKVGPTVLVLAPTRELATQIQEEAVKFGRSSRISCTCLYGGAPKGPQLRDLDRGVDVVVATPGRLNDILEMRRISLRQVSYLVLDEADRMLDMGFEPQIRKIVKEVPHRRQTLMFTATWPKEVRKIAADLLVHPVQVNIGSIDELVANNAITQYVEVITPAEKLRRLEQILRSQDPGSKILVFCSTKRMCDQLSRTLSRQFGAVAIHGDKSQSERDRVLSQFRSGRSPILVATDVAARGLDIKDIRVVINYDFPTGVEDYVHRIGRTGRAGATGVSYTFFCENDSKYAADLVKVLEGADQRVPRELRDMVSRGGYGGKSRRWGSRSGGSRDEGRSRARGDSGRSGRAAREPLPFSERKSDSGRGGRSRDDHDPYGRNSRNYQDDHDTDAHDHKSGGRGRSSRSRSRGYSPSPKRGRVGGWQNGRSHSRSRSRSRSRSGSQNHYYSHSRSRSRSVSRDFDKLGAERRTVSPAAHHRPDDDIKHSPSPRHNEKQISPPPPQLNDNDNMMKDVRHDGSPSPSPKKERSPYDSNTNNGAGSPSQGGNGGGARSPSPLPTNARYNKDRDGEEEEEGMIPADEDDGEILPEEDGGGTSPPGPMEETHRPDSDR
uniref:RNA helicase n=1 Tax=Ananas comosus var. bracteatus TaxID=296719 RepID=A0A6V7PVV8_ANACO|nr:unnamed protein product [Ananas comosus var. bracteatus]